MSWITGNKHLASTPQVDTVAHINQTKWLETGLEKHRSHSSFTKDELGGDFGEGGDIDISTHAATEWCAKPGSAYPDGTRFVQVIMDIDSSPHSVWFQLPSHTVVSAPNIGDIERCCCDTVSYHDHNHQPNYN